MDLPVVGVQVLIKLFIVKREELLCRQPCVFDMGCHDADNFAMSSRGKECRFAILVYGCRVLHKCLALGSNQYQLNYIIFRYRIGLSSTILFTFFLTIYK